MGSHKLVRRREEFAALETAYRSELDGRRRSHLQVIWLLLQGDSVADAARVTGFSGRWISSLIDRWNGSGLCGLGDRRHKNKGAERMLDDAGLAALEAALQEDPADGGVWSGRQVAAWMSDYLGRAVSPKRGLDYLHRLDYSRQQPRPRHAPGTPRQRARKNRRNSKKSCQDSGGAAARNRW